MPSIKRSSTVNPVPTTEEVAHVLSELTRSGEGNAYCASLLAVDCGLRRNEIIGLRWKDVDIDNRTITIYDTPARHPRIVRMTDRVRRELETGAGEADTEAHVLRQGRERTAVGTKLTSTVSKMGNRLGIHISLHSLRQKCIVDAVNTGASMCEVKRTFGYRCENTWDCCVPLCHGASSLRRLYTSASREE